MAILKVNILPKEEKKPDYEVGFEDGKAVGYDKGLEDGGYDRGYEKGYTEGNEKGFKDGYFEGQEQSASLFGILNEVTGTNIATCDYVNENPHNVEVKLSSDNVTDFSGVEVKCIGKNIYNGEDFETIDYRGYDLMRFNPPLPIGTYTFSALVISTDTDSETCLLGGFGNIPKGDSNTRTYVTKTLTKELADMYVYSSNNAQNSKDYKLILKDIQIERLEGVTEYEPYTEKTYTANADGTLDVTSISPTMNIICEGVDISAKYYCSPTAEYDRFWDNYQEFGNRKNYKYGFTYSGWTQSNFKPKYDMYPTHANNFLASTLVEDLRAIVDECGITIDFANTVTNATFLSAQKLKRITPFNVINAPNLYNTFSYCVELETIEAIENINAKQTFSQTFHLCSKLRHITLINCEIGNSINLQWSSLLEVESAKSFIRCLVNLIETNPFTQTIYFHADVWNKLAEEGNTSPNGNTWEDYLQDIGWNKG